MPRWQPGASKRLQQAALTLFAAHGFERTTIDAIADAAGVTSRTFFRYFLDKPDVLFHNYYRVFREAVIAGANRAADGATAIDVVNDALQCAALLFAGIHVELLRCRFDVIQASLSLKERERAEDATVAVQLAQILRGRGASDLHALLASKTAMTIFEVAFAQWVTTDQPGDLGQAIEIVTTEMRGLMAQQDPRGT